MKPVKRRRRPSYAKLYKVLGLPKKWVVVLNQSPRPLEVLQILLAAKTGQEICNSLDDLTDALLDAVGDEVTETGEIVTVQ
jgi:hypothetical protein